MLWKIIELYTQISLKCVTPKVYTFTMGFQVVAKKELMDSKQ
jgi:hypothetical protein